MQSPLGLDRPDSALLRPSGTGRGSLRRVRYGALAIAIIGATGLLFLYLPGHPPPRPALAAPALTVTTAAPHVATWATTVSATGGIFPWQEASAGTQIGSYQIIDVQANVGDQVRKGQVLARLNPALLQAEEAQLVAGHDQAEANRQRALSLQGSGGISDQDVLQLVTQAKTSAAQLAAKRLQLRYTTVTAPDDGVVSARTAALGAVVPAGQELFRIIRHNRLEWRGELTAAQIASIAPGQPISLTLPDGSQTLARTRITGPALDGQSRLGLVYADIVPGGRARAGMYASGRISIGQRPALAVPAASVVVRDGRSYVFRLVDGSGASSPVRAQAVTVGRRLGDEVEIVEGLSGAEKLVVEGAGFLGDGDVVRIQASQPGQSGAARP
ncbi:efflux RND transporter periplasmic adaptor subunit [uncultured Sphingomonas sp.]|uniref:efflux RND transporter periplasmic adaptor subunit n=1 Tax=uncultured Sphingomonas sp. TaxID=158754 RepID=UPI0035CB70FE